MKEETALFIVLALFIILAGIIFILQQREIRKTFFQLNAMLDEAIKGDFQEKRYDESQLSKVSVKLKRFLVSSLLSQSNIQKEKESVKALISDISHQTKTPITNILLYTQLLSEDTTLTSECRSHTEMIRKQSEKLDFLLQALVKTSRLETGIITVNPAFGVLNQAVLAAVEEVHTKAEHKDITLKVLMDKNYEAAFDLKWTIEAIYNVLDNAVKYTQPGGEITITIQDYEMFARLDISDTGIGIKENELNKIFRRFYRGQEAALQDGVGIGLYLTRKILMEEGGYIKVTSKPKEGTTFSLFFSRKA